MLCLVCLYIVSLKGICAISRMHPRNISSKCPVLRQDWYLLFYFNMHFWQILRPFMQLVPILWQYLFMETVQRLGMVPWQIIFLVCSFSIAFIPILHLFTYIWCLYVIFYSNDHNTYILYFFGMQNLIFPCT